MTTYVTFTPSTQNSPPFSFQATLDGATYTITTAWNFAAQRWYLSVTDQFNNLVVNRPMLGSPPKVPLSALSWENGIVTATAPSYLGYRLGAAVTVSVSGAVPIALNGTFKCSIIRPELFVYPMASDPGPVTNFGSFSVDCNLAGGYFNTSTLVWRPSTGNLEVNP